MDSFRERRHGQICILSSVAGLGMNFISPLYSSTKIANYAFGEGTWLSLSDTQLSVVFSLLTGCLRMWFGLVRTADRSDE